MSSGDSQPKGSKGSKGNHTVGHTVLPFGLDPDDEIDITAKSLWQMWSLAAKVSVVTSAMVAWFMLSAVVYAIGQVVGPNQMGYVGIGVVLGAAITLLVTWLRRLR